MARRRLTIVSASDQTAYCPPAGTGSSGLLFNGDFTNWNLGNVHTTGINPATGSIEPYDWISDPDTGSTHAPSIVTDPLGSGAHVFAATVDTTDTPPAPITSTRVDLVGPVSSTLARPGLETWTYVEMMFPSTVVNGAAYVPTMGDWNWNFQWHASNVGGTGDQPFAMGMSTGQTPPLTNCNGGLSNNNNPQLYYKHDGGLIVGGVKPAASRICTLQVITFDHWYGLLIRIKWATDSTGIIQTWLDGTQLENYSGPTLFQDSSTNAIDTPYLIVGNYRWAGDATHIVNWSSTILYKKVRVALTQAAAVSG